MLGKFKPKGANYQHVREVPGNFLGQGVINNSNGAISTAPITDFLLICCVIIRFLTGDPSGTLILPCLGMLASMPLCLIICASQNQPVLIVDFEILFCLSLLGYLYSE